MLTWKHKVLREYYIHNKFHLDQNQNLKEEDFDILYDLIEAMIRYEMQSLRE